ncbi:hypothetical protein B0H67DRAFT_106629 [Lasiosphaeris hirsuta]|uniref:Uncharacterized protein n=1 Tax=Lasiosphaeris hirsuta TaxID=260670 RepID=A0AA40AYU1_9PEZI|nr:hypothetical protein B0H67DRAFT_106629 [Lasiosphaeris hirsuta]
MQQMSEKSHSDAETELVPRPGPDENFDLCDLGLFLFPFTPRGRLPRLPWCRKEPLPDEERGASTKALPSSQLPRCLSSKLSARRPAADSGDTVGGPAEKTPLLVLPSIENDSEDDDEAHRNEKPAEKQDEPPSSRRRSSRISRFSRKRHAAEEEKEKSTASGKKRVAL